MLLVQTEYKGEDQLGVPVRMFLDVDPLLATAVIIASEGIILFILGLVLALGIVMLATRFLGKFLKNEKQRKLLEKITFRYLPLVVIIAFITWAIFPFGFDRNLPLPLLLGAITVGVTLLLGRVFCGWFCPMGAVLQFVSWLKKDKTKKRIELNTYQNNQRWKYYFLIGLMVAATLGFQITGMFDPISTVIRGFSLIISPIVNQAFNGMYDLAYATENDTVIGIADEVYNFVGYPNILSFSQPHFTGLFLVVVMFGGMLALNWVRPRFWCRVLCPLGALLGTISRHTPYRLRMTKDSCVNCGKCNVNCQGACDPEFKEGWRPSECFVCFACVDSCPTSALKFSFRDRVEKDKPSIGVDIKKRRAFQAVGTSLVAVPLIKASGLYKEDVGGANDGPAVNNPSLIRPPGALPEKEFLQRCIRCGECMKVCATNGLHPTTFEAGLEGMWTPILVPELGYCEYNCTLCGQVCPTGAIQELDVETKKKTVIGTAFFDFNRCLPYAFGKDCICCEEHCPTSPKAIWFEVVPRSTRPEESLTAENDPYGSGDYAYGSETPETTESSDDYAEAENQETQADPYAASDPYGSSDPYSSHEAIDKSMIRQPKVDLERCIGCGICEKVCVIADKPAIRITSVGESRSNSNAIIFEGTYEDQY